MLETQLQGGEIKESEINLKIGLPMASGSISFELFWQVSITDHGWELLPIALKSNDPGQGRAQIQTPAMEEHICAGVKLCYPT